MAAELARAGGTLMFETALAEARLGRLNEQDHKILDLFKSKMSRRWHESLWGNQDRVRGFITKIKIGADDGAGYLEITADGNLQHYRQVTQLMRKRLGVKFTNDNNRRVTDAWKLKGKHLTYIGVLLAEKSYLSG